jgi:hypothetical protein
VWSYLYLVQLTAAKQHSCENRSTKFEIQFDFAGRLTVRMFFSSPQVSVDDKRSLIAATKVLSVVSNEAHLAANGTRFRLYRSKPIPSSAASASFSCPTRYFCLCLICNKLLILLRTNQSALLRITKIYGTSYREETYIHVTWAWLMLPGVVVFMAVVLLAASIVSSRGLNGGLWKNSALALLFTQIRGCEHEGLKVGRWSEI